MKKAQLFIRALLETISPIKIMWLLALVIVVFCLIFYSLGDMPLEQFLIIVLGYGAFAAIGSICYMLFVGFIELEEDEQKEAEAEKARQLEDLARLRREYRKTTATESYRGETNITVNVEYTVPPTKLEALQEAVNNFNPKKEPIKPKPETEKPKPIVEEGKSKAEKEGNTITGPDGKPVVKPNYKMIASEWVRGNLELLNKICNDAYAISGGSSSYSATIPAAYLPEEKASWIVIGKTLVAEDDISSFRILKEGLEVTVS